MTTVIARCFERTVNHHYSKKVFEGNLTVIQYAYREGCSCKEALIQIQYNYLNALDARGGGALPYMGYIGMCRCEGYGFQAVYSRIRYINQSVWV